MRCRIGFKSEQGPREYNEDNGLALQSSVVGKEVVLLGVCDGMGGDANGGRAAKIVTSALSSFLAYLPLTFLERSTAPLVEQVIRDAISNWYSVTLRQLEELGERERLRGLTTTLVACLSWDDQLAVWWLGDSRLYRFRDGRLERLTEDHSKVEQTLGLPEEEALEHPERNKVSQFVRPGNLVQPEIRFYDWQDGDVIFAVSDGVSNGCRSWELESFIAYSLAADIDPDALCQQILKYIRKNMQDNATIAMSIRGVAKPFIQDMATLEIPVFVRQGLKDDLVNALTKYPTTSQEWLSRKTPVWRDSSPLSQPGLSLQDRRIAGTKALSNGTSEVDSLCLVCGHRTRFPGACPKHGHQHLWKGLYFEIIAPSGEISYHPVGMNKKYLIGRPDPLQAPDVALASDEMISPAHAFISIDHNGDTHVRDLLSDNGVWLRVRDVCLASTDWLQEGISIMIGRHQVSLRSTSIVADEPRQQQQIRLLKPSKNEIASGSGSLTVVDTSEGIGATDETHSTEDQGSATKTDGGGRDLNVPIKKSSDTRGLLEYVKWLMFFGKDSNR